MPLKDYAGPLLSNQTPDGPAFGKCGTCGNVMFDGVCKVCEAQARVDARAQPPTPPSRQVLTVEPPEPAPTAESDLTERTLALTVYYRGDTLGVEVLIADDTTHARGTGDTVALAFASAWDQFDRPLLTEGDIAQALDDLSVTKSSEDIAALFYRIAALGAQRAAQR